MTKSIIIDGVNVSGCEFFRAIGADLYCECENNKLNFIGNTAFSCKFNPNCYYKQLQRLKEEHETLLQTYTACEKEYKVLCKRYHELQAELRRVELSEKVYTPS